MMTTIMSLSNDKLLTAFVSKSLKLKSHRTVQNFGIVKYDRRSERMRLAHQLGALPTVVCDVADGSLARTENAFIDVGGLSRVNTSQYRCREIRQV